VRDVIAGSDLMILLYH